MRAPPNRSASLPPNGRASEPTSGPRKAKGDRGGAQGEGRIFGEGIGDQLRKDRGETDEGAEGADVQGRDDPQVLLTQAGQCSAQIRPRAGQIMHTAPRTTRGKQDQRDPDDACQRKLQGSGGEHGDGDGHQQLGYRGAQVAAGGVQTQGPAFLRGGVEVGDVGHRGGKVSATETCKPCKGQHRPEGGAGMCDCQGQAAGRDQQQQGRGDGPVAAAEAGHHEGIGNAEGGTDQARHGDQPEQLGGAVFESSGRQIHRDDGEQLPHREAEEFGEDRPAQVDRCGVAAHRIPERGIFCVPIIDPASLGQLE